MENYIENYNIATGAYTKLCMDAGINLTVVGDKLYYINVDWMTSTVFGKGIYCVDAYPNKNSSSIGDRIISGGEAYSSLTYLGDNKIAYYKVTGTQELIICNLITKQEKNVLEGFVAPETYPLSMGSKMLTYNGLVYYLNLHKDKALYSYNPQTGKSAKLTANKVSDFNIIGDYLYYNSVSYLVNNDLYRINLKAGGEPEQISTYDANDIIFDGVNVFFIEKNVSGVSTAIRKVSADGTDPIVYSKGVSNLRYYDGYMYFLDGDTLYRMSTSNYTVDEAMMLKKKDVDVFEIYNGVIYYREVLIVNKQLSKINVDGTGDEVVVTGYDPVDIVIQDGYIYFYSDTVKASTAGIYKIAIGGNQVVKVMPKDTSYYPSEMVVLGNDIYFVNYALGGIAGDSHLYKVNMTSGQVTKIG